MAVKNILVFCLVEMFIVKKLGLCLINAATNMCWLNSFTSH